jgi:hypothetical protein
MNRRNFIVGGTFFGLTIPEILQAQYGDNNATAQNIIHIFLPGGISHQESFDPKPLADSDYRGPFSAINTNVDGIQLGEYFTHTAKIADKLTIINSMTHGEAEHERGTHNMFTGYKPSPALTYPSFGSVISHELEAINNLPKYVSVPNQANVHAGTGFLSSKYNSFSLGSEPSSPNFKVRDLDIPVDEKRFSRRKNILEAVNSKFESSVESDSMKAVDEFYNQAYSLIGSESAKSAFDLSKEDSKIKESYGTGIAGQRFLMSRRLIESGVRMVSVTFGSWDHHDNIKLGYEQAKEFDKAYAALISDLSDRGLLDTTLVIVSSEFGRTPKINKTAGRDHWPRVFSSVLAGGGVKGGIKFGASDSLGAEVDTNPVTPADLAMTMYKAVGIDGSKELMSPGLRPVRIAPVGSVLDIF